MHVVNHNVKCGQVGFKTGKHDNVGHKVIHLNY